jgi:hypothetical protein
MSISTSAGCSWSTSAMASLEAWQAPEHGLHRHPEGRLVVHDEHGVRAGHIPSFA